MIEDFKEEINKYLKDIGQCNQTQAFKNEMKNIKTYRKIHIYIYAYIYNMPILTT